MSRYTHLSNPIDGYISSLAATYADARSGTNLSANQGSFITVGQTLVNGDFYYAYQGFLSFGTTEPTDELVTSAHLLIDGFIGQGGSASWTLEAREHEWGPSLTTADWVDGASIAADAPSLLAQYGNVARIKRPFVRSGTAALRTRLTTEGPLEILLCSNRHRIGLAPSGNETISVGSFEYAAKRPRLEYLTTRESALTRALSASVQLSDGTTVFLDLDSGTPVLKHNPSGTIYTTIGTLPIGNNPTDFALADGAQALALVRDRSDNLYVVGPAGGLVNGLAVKAFVKGSGHSWTQKAAIASALPRYADGAINQVTATWHDLAGGWIVAVVGHAQGSDTSNQVITATVPCVNARLASGTAVITAEQIAALAEGAAVNCSGNGLDVLALNSTLGVIASAAQDSTFGDANVYSRAYSYRITAGGGFEAARSYSGVFNSPADGDNRVKIVPISATSFAVFWLGYLRTFTVSGPFSLSTTSSVDLTGAGIASYGTSRTRAADAVYDRATSRVWIYYPDQANTRRIMRTGYLPGANLLDGSEIEVAAAMGPSGSTNRALRLPRGVVDERRLLVHLGNRSGGSTDALVALVDIGLNQAPNAPVLTAPGTFNATQARTLAWRFSDNNQLDRQSAYQLQIRDQSSAVVVLDSGKVTGTASSTVLPAGTLSNGETYEWRVRTYDTSDTVGAYSAYQLFSTITTGLAEIVDPADDNPPGLVSPVLTITWMFVVGGGLAQAGYRVRVVRTDSGDTVFDTGYISAPTATQHTLTGLVTDVEQRIELLVTDSGGDVSNTATRLVTPSFGAPDAPSLFAVPNDDDSGVLVTVVNSEPTGDLPPAGRNDIFRALAGTDEFIKVGEATPGEVFTDLGAASGTAYDYLAYAVADGRTPSNVVEDVTVSLLGVWVHDPLDAETTIRHFLYGGSVNAEEVGTEGTELRFVGRAYPIFDFGEQLSQQVSVKITVPFGDSHRADLDYLREMGRSRAVRCFRDGRGRKVFGVISAVSLDDAVYGTDAALTVVRAEFAEELS